MANRLDQENLHRPLHETEALENNDKSGEVCSSLPVRATPEGGAEEPGKVLGEAPDKELVCLRQHYANITAEASRLSGVPVGGLLSRTRSEPTATVRSTLIKAIYDRSTKGSRKHIAAFFERDRTAIAYSAGRFARYPEWDADLYVKLIDFIDSLPKEMKAEPVKPEKASPKMLEQLAKARAVLKERSIARGSHFKTPETAANAIARYKAQLEFYRQREIMRRAKNRRQPKCGDPLIRELFKIMAREMCTNRDLEKRSGVSEWSISMWSKGRRSPNLGNVVACFQALGYRLEPVPIGDEEA